MSGSGTRIASISGLRGVVGDGLDPAGRRRVRGGLRRASARRGRSWWVTTDGSRPRSSAAAVEAGVTATGHDVLAAGPTATPTIGVLVRDHRGGRRHPDLGLAQSAQIQRPQVLPATTGMVLSQRQGAGRARPLAAPRILLGELGFARHASRGSKIPTEGHLARVLQVVDVAAIRRRDFKVVLDACHGAGGRLGRALLEALGCRTIVLGGEPDGRYDHPPEPTEANLKEFAAIVPRDRRGGRLCPGSRCRPAGDRRRNRPVHRRGADPGPGGSAAAWSRPEGPVVLNLSTSRVTEDLARRAGARSSELRSARSTSSSGCWPKMRCWAAKEMAA